MKRASLALFVLAVLVFATGCVSKKQYASLQTDLATCQEEKAQAEAQVITWEQRFDREAERWETVGASITDQVPKALSELNAERDRIVELVPQQVRSEVETYLDEYFATVMAGFQSMTDDNREIKMQLAATHKVLESLGADTRDVAAKIDTTLADERDKRRQEQDRRESVASRISDVVTTLSEFDGTRINCAKCPERLKLNRKERETLSALHSRLVTELSKIQSFAATDYELPTEDVPAAPLGP
jgi:chromosome segregation ATPase